MNIGDNIRRARHKKGLSQKALGKLLEMSPVMISQYENGRRVPKFDTLTRFCTALECSIDDLTDPFPSVNSMSFSSDSKRLVENGYLAPDISPKELNEKLQNLPFEGVTDFEKLIIYYNSLNDSGKDKLFEYFELLLDSPKYRNTNIQVGDAPRKESPHNLNTTDNIEPKE